MKTLIVIHNHYSDSTGPTRAYGPYYDVAEAEAVCAHLSSLTSDTYGSGEWRVMALTSLAVESAS